MEYTDPFAVVLPPGARHVGQPPFWTSGQSVTWTYRRFDYARNPAEVRRPMTVIEDGPTGAVLWMPGGTEVTDTRVVGWEDVSAHEVPLAVRFRPPAEAPSRTMVPARWQGRGVLKIVPAEVPFSVWVLLKPAEAAGRSGSVAEAAGRTSSAGPSGSAGASAEPVRAEWYINLETTHRRTGAAVFTSDLILDITFPVPEEPLHACDGSLNPRGAVFKDVDEIAAAAKSGYWPAEWSDIVRANGSLVLDRLEEHRWAFDPKWEEVARELAGERVGPRLGPAAVKRPDENGRATSAGDGVLPSATAASVDAPPIAAPTGEDTSPPATSAGDNSAGEREHRRIPAGCYIRPDSQ